MKLAINPRFAIMNTCDAPQRRMVCEWVPRVGYCYMMRGDESQLRTYDGMKPTRPTAIEQFGFTVELHGKTALFVRVCDSTATYEEGVIRPWQDRTWIDQFELPLVSLEQVRGGARSRGER